MKNIFKNKVAVQVLLLAAIIALFSTPFGREHAELVQPILESLFNM